MINKNKKQFGVWMDTHNATIVGSNEAQDGFVILGHVKNDGSEKNSSENAQNNQEQSLTLKFFKEIAALMPNVDEIHLTGTGQIQEQFKHFLAETPQYKNAISTDDTSNKMSDESLITYISNHFN